MRNFTSIAGTAGTQRSAEPLPLWQCALAILLSSAICYWLIFRAAEALAHAFQIVRDSF